MSGEAPPPLAILVVDPLAGRAAGTRSMLEALGHSATCVHDWRQAGNRLTLWTYDAVVMAAETPGQRDRGAVEMLRAGPARSAGLPLVGIAAATELRAQERALAAGCDQVLSHPFPAEALEAALREAVRLRAPPVLLDADRRAALRAQHGPAALEALDTAALDLAAGLLIPILTDGAGTPEILAAAEAIAPAMADIGAIQAEAAARDLGEDARRGPAAAGPLMSAVVAARFALRRDRMNAAAQDPIWAASDQPPGDPT
jgi:CheY-like chemotaxis protein